MSSLNLIPNPPVLAVQAGIFLVNCVIVKKFFVEPYLTVRDRRDRLTIGNKDEAIKALSKGEAIATEIASTISNAADQAKKERERLRNIAMEKRAGIVQAAEADARAAVDAIEKQIQADVLAEKAKIPSVVQALSKQVYELALN